MWPRRDIGLWAPLIGQAGAKSTAVRLPTCPGWSPLHPAEITTSGMATVPADDPHDSPPAAHEGRRAGDVLSESDEGGLTEAPEEDAFMFRKMGKKFKTRLRKLTDALLLSSRTEKGEPEGGKPEEGKPEEGDPERAPSPVEPEGRTKDAGEADAAIESPNPETEAETEAGARASPEMAPAEDLATLLWSALRIPLYQLERDEYGRRGIPMILGLLKVYQLPYRLFPPILIRGFSRD